MKNSYILTKQPNTKPIGEVGNVSIEVSVDVLQILLLVISGITCIYAFLAKKRIYLAPLANVLTKLKPQDFHRDKEIEGIMNRMLATASNGEKSASRVVVALFTNGTKAHLFPFRYFSVFWEVTSEGVNATKLNYQHIPLDKIRDDLELYMGNDTCFIQSSVNDKGLAIKCKSYLESYGIHTVLGRLIGNKKDGYCGIINIHYEDEIHINKEQTSKLESLFLILSKKILATN